MQTYPLFVGSENPIKVKAAEAAVDTDPRLRRRITEVVPIKVASAVSAQPKSLRETVQGALHRAYTAVETGSYSSFREEGWGAGLGIESGVFTVRQVHGKDMVFDTTVCALVMPGIEPMIGMCPCWQLPADLVDALADGLEMDEALFATKRTTNPDLGQAEGAIGLLSQGRLTRLTYTLLAIQAAMLSWKGG